MFLNIYKKKPRPYDNLCRIHSQNDTETRNIIVLHVYLGILINFIGV